MFQGGSGALVICGADKYYQSTQPRRQREAFCDLVFTFGGCHASRVELSSFRFSSIPEIKIVTKAKHALDFAAKRSGDVVVGRAASWNGA
jgi:hypothetical protein